jgi:DNA repair photolyase
MRVPRRDWGNFVEVKKNIPNTLAEELKKKKKGVVGISTTTDPYQPAEEKYKLTRYCLEQLLKHDFPISILTKSPLVARDIDLLSKFSDVEIGFTISTINDEERKMLEPGTESIQSRINAIAKCNKNDIITYAFLGPLYPTMDEEKLIKLVRQIKNAGASYIMVDRLNLRPGIWKSMSEALQKNPAALKIWKEAIFGDGAVYENLYKLLEEMCRDADIEYKDAWVSVINP